MHLEHLKTTCKLIKRLFSEFSLFAARMKRPTQRHRERLPFCATVRSRRTSYNSRARVSLIVTARPLPILPPRCFGAWLQSGRFRASRPTPRTKSSHLRHSRERTTTWSTYHDHPSCSPHQQQQKQAVAQMIIPRVRPRLQVADRTVATLRSWEPCHKVTNLTKGPGVPASLRCRRDAASQLDCCAHCSHRLQEALAETSLPKSARRWT